MEISKYAMPAIAIFMNGDVREQVHRELAPYDMDILLEDNCTKAEAKKYLETGTTIYRDLEEGLEGYCEEWDNCCADDGYSDMVREMVRTHKPCTDWGCVEIEGKWYYIMYVL